MITFDRGNGFNRAFLSGRFKPNAYNFEVLYNRMWGELPANWDITGFEDEEGTTTLIWNGHGQAVVISTPEDVARRSGKESEEYWSNQVSYCAGKLAGLQDKLEKALEGV